LINIYSSSMENVCKPRGANYISLEGLKSYKWQLTTLQN